MVMPRICSSSLHHSILSTRINNCSPILRARTHTQRPRHVRAVQKPQLASQLRGNDSVRGHQAIRKSAEPRTPNKPQTTQSTNASSAMLIMQGREGVLVRGLPVVNVCEDAYVADALRVRLQPQQLLRTHALRARRRHFSKTKKPAPVIPPRSSLLRALKRA